MTDRRTLLMTWMRGKGIHPLDVRCALEWYDRKVANREEPKDLDVLMKAYNSHRAPLLSVRYAAIGAIIGVFFAEVVKWALVMMLSLL